MRKTIIGFVAAAALLAACGSGGNDDTTINPGAAGPAETQATTPAPATAKVGGTLAVKTNGVHAEWTLNQAETRTADQFGAQAPNNGTYLLVKVTVKVRQGTEAFVCSCDLAVISAKGKVHEPTFATFDNRPDLTTATVAAGQNTDGWVTFAVTAADLKGARLQLKQSSFIEGATFGYWTLNVK